MHPFVKACRASYIGRTVRKSNNSARMMVLKGWRDVLPEVRRKEPKRSAIGLRTDFDAQTVRSIAQRLKSAGTRLRFGAMLAKKGRRG